jgi:hypothetical protein
MQRAWGEKECVQFFCLESLKRTLGRPRRRWEDNIKVDLRETALVMWTGFI